MNVIILNYLFVKKNISIIKKILYFVKLIMTVKKQLKY